MFFLIAGLIVGFAESRLMTSSGLIERLSSATDERDFSVKLTHPDGKIEWLEQTPQKLFSSPERIIRKQISRTHEAVVLESLDEARVLGNAPRVFEKNEDPYSCEAVARIDFPTPLSEPADLLISKLKCLEKIPQTETAQIKVLGKENKSWVSCDAHEKNCVWDHHYRNVPEAAAQASALGFIWSAFKTLTLNHLEPAMKVLIAKSLAVNADKSSYDARHRSLTYGAGNYLDALDGFVVVHEWTHAVIDDLNPALYGYEATVLHEAVADFVATDLFDSPCFAPFDAQEIPNRKCVRDLTLSKNYLHDMTGENAHEDSLVLSSALWEARQPLTSPLLQEMILEALIRLPKNPQLKSFWIKLNQVYSRLLLERTTLIDHRRELDEIAQRHGLL